MLLSSKITDFFFVIDEFSLVFDATMKKSPYPIVKFIAISFIRCPKVKSPLFGYYFI